MVKEEIEKLQIIKKRESRRRSLSYFFFRFRDGFRDRRRSGFRDRRERLRDRRYDRRFFFYERNGLRLRDRRRRLYFDDRRDLRLRERRYYRDSYSRERRSLREKFRDDSVDRSRYRLYRRLFFLFIRQEDKVSSISVVIGVSIRSLINMILVEKKKLQWERERGNIQILFYFKQDL